MKYYLNQLLMIGTKKSIMRYLSANAKNWIGVTRLYLTVSMGLIKKFIVTVDGEACHFDLSIHVKAQLARRSTKYGFMRNHVLYKLFEYYGRGLKDKPREEALAFSQSYQYGVIVDIFNNETPKRYRLITFLPKGRKRPQPGTPLYLCEWLDYLPYYVVE